jgi:signal transduction histidine kinase
MRLVYLWKKLGDLDLASALTEADKEQLRSRISDVQEILRENTDETQRRLVDLLGGR